LVKSSISSSSSFLLTSSTMHTKHFPRANGAERRSGRKPVARVLIPPGYLHSGKGTHYYALAKSKVHQISRAHGVWVVISLI
jgi:hypothetical protein